MRLHGARKSGLGALTAPSGYIVVAAALCALAGCGTSPSPSPTSAPTAPAASTVAPTEAASTSEAMTAACADIDKLKSSVDALNKVNPTKEGAAALSAAIANVQTKLDAAEKSAASSPALQPGVAKVKTAVEALKSATSGLNTGNLAQKAPSIVVASKEVATAMSALSSTVSKVCT